MNDTRHTDSTPPELTDTGVFKLAQAYAAGTKRIMAHFEAITDATYRRAKESRDYLAEGVK